MDENISSRIISNDSNKIPIKGKQIRDLMFKFKSDVSSLDWVCVYNCLHCNTSNNVKLIQFQ